MQEDVVACKFGKFFAISELRLKNQLYGLSHSIWYFCSPVKIIQDLETKRRRTPGPLFSGAGFASRGCVIGSTPRHKRGVVGRGGSERSHQKRHILRENLNKCFIVV